MTSNRNGSSGRDRRKTPRTSERPLSDVFDRLNDGEKAAMRRTSRRISNDVKTPSYRRASTSDGQTYLSPLGDRRVQEFLQLDLFATGNDRFRRAMENDLAHAFKGRDDLCPTEFEEALAIVRAIAPRNESEALLAVQMAAVHNAIIMAAGQLRRAQVLDHQDSAGKILSKLTRTSCMQFETLKKLRSTGEQVVHVQHQHVTVNDGGQAIVAGQVSPRGGGKEKRRGQPHEPSTSSERGAPMLCKIETQQSPMPSASSSGLESLQMSRRTRGRP